MRSDIQALRGLAVLLVVIHHYDLAPLPAGYLGVDIFFVVSGFLITALIAKPSFTFKDFYWRRAKRLFPAAFVTFAFTAALAPFFLVDSEMDDFIQQLLGALTFTANVVLWSQEGYFEQAAKFKPLLHTWSLAIEEQFYLLLPALMVILPKRFWFSVLTATFLSSIFLCFVFIEIRPSATFYLLPTRAWELLLGSLGAIAFRNIKISTGAYWLALSAVFLLPIFPLSNNHPSVDAFLICIATMIIILGNRPLLDRTGLKYIGNFSYSLYLTHWPILVFAQHVWLGVVPLSVRISLLGLSLILSFLLYRFVEMPCRRAEIHPSKRLCLGVSSIVVAIFFIPSAAPRSKHDYVEMMRKNYGFDESCDSRAIDIPIETCRNSDAPEVIVWGDSFAMHLVPGLANVSDRGVVQATRSFCGPILDLAPIEKSTRYNRNWAEYCLEFNMNVLDLILNSRNIKTVVLSSLFSQYTDAQKYSNLTVSGDVFLPNLETTAKALNETINRLRAIEKNVVIISPPPIAEFNVGRCLERQATQKLLVQDCDIPKSDYLKTSSSVLALMDRVVAPVLRLDHILCDEDVCKTEWDGVPLYRDEGHLSHDGSIVLMHYLAEVGLLRDVKLIELTQTLSSTNQDLLPQPDITPAEGGRRELQPQTQLEQ